MSSDPANKLLIPPLMHTTPITSFSLVSEVRSAEASATHPFDLLIQTATRQWDLNSRFAKSHVASVGFSKPVLKDVTPPSVVLPPLRRISVSSLSSPSAPATDNYQSVTSSFFPNDRSNVFAREPKSESPTFGSVAPILSVAPDLKRGSADSGSADLPKTQPVETVLASFSARTQRQRTGPSCHACRSRKIKCDAQMLVISASSSESSAEPQSLLSASTDLSKIDSWIEGCQLLGESKDSNDWLIFRVDSIASESFSSEGHISPKHEVILIKFKKCTACTKKSCSCFFDKGFNKLDVERFKLGEFEGTVQAPRLDKPETAPRKRRSTDDETGCAKSESGGQRRSSCNGCRSRKIKCVRKVSESKCVHCLRRDIDCSMP